MDTITINGITIGQGAPKICAPITGGDMGNILKNASYVAGLEPDLIEWRCDLFENANDSGEILAALGRIKDIIRGIPLIFTLRTKSEGGNADFSDDYYTGVCKMVADTRLAEFVDLELRLPKRLLTELTEHLKYREVYSIISYHNFSHTPTIDRIVSILEDEQNSGGDILKVAVMPETFQDVLKLMSSVMYFIDNFCKKPVVAISMGEIGLASRILGGFFGSHITFAAGAEPSAPGQAGVAEMRLMLNEILKSLR